jgi:Ca2+/H+ antiporter, TMEM165/GDT1 family
MLPGPPHAPAGGARSVVESLFIAFGLVFVAELGDKTQLVALSLASRYRPLPVLVGLTLAQAAAQGLAVLVGGLLGAALPTTAISIGAGVLFLGFAVWTLRADDDEGVEVSGRFVVLAVAMAIFIAEMGDKTMLASATLAAQGNPVLVWIGGTAGVVAAGGVAILVGRSLGARLPAHIIRYVAAGLFALFGLALLAEAAGLISF